MRRVWGVAAACLVVGIAGCGGVAELDSGETETVSSVRSVVENAAATGSMKPGDEEKIRAFMALCREKPLAEDGGDSMRQILDGLAPQVKAADPELSKTMQRVATSGCD